MTPLSHLLSPLPGLTLPPTYAPFPVWSGSTTAPARFLAMPKKAAIKLWHRAREFDRQSHEPGRHGGTVGRTALAVLHSLVFDFLNHRTGRLDPSYAAIAHKAGMSVRAVSDALKHLRELGLLHRIRRCVEDWQGGQFRLRQETNAYATAAGDLLAGLAAASRAASACPGHLGRSIAPADRRRPGGSGARSRGEGSGAQNRTRRGPGGRSGAAGREPVEPTRIVSLFGVQWLRRNLSKTQTH